MTPRGSRRLWLIAGAVVILSGFGYLIYGGIGENLVYFLTPAELHAKGASAYDEPVRLGGQVVPGSVKWDAQNIDLSFRLREGSETIVVHSRKAPPQMFREGQGVIVEGKLNRSGVFESSNLLVKHSNEYQPPADHAARPKDLYKSLIREKADR
jgi:cytochrome c-type biogenesis protein CcmE